MRTQDKGNTGKRPGVMIYFDMVEPILSLRDAEKGRLLMAIVAYAREGTLPRFTGRMAMAWGYIQPKLDRDAESYENTRTQKRYAVFCRERTKKKLPKIPMHVWLAMTEEERLQLLAEEPADHRPDAPDPSRYPTGKGNGKGDGNGKGYGDGDGYGEGEEDGEGEDKTNRYKLVSAAAAADTASDLAAAAAKNELKKMGGELGQGVVNLTEYQIDRLLDQMGLDMFDYYVKKLSDYILRNNASVKNHYSTILRWWQEDRGC